MMARRKIVMLVAGLVALCGILAVGLGGCKDLTFNGDMKGYLEYWTATLGVSNPQVSEGYQMDSSGRMTISTGESVTVTATVENPDGHAVNGGVGPSSDILKSVRISGAAGDIALSSGPRVTASPTSLTLELPPLSPVPTEATRRAEHKDFTVLLAPVRTETNMSPSNPLSLTLRYNTPPRMPLAVIEDGGSFRWPKDGDRWEVSGSGEICWAWPKDKTKAGGGSATDPDYVEWFYIEDGMTDKLEAEADLLQPNSNTLPSKDGIDYNVYKATGLAPSASVRVYAEDGDRVRGQAAVSGPIHTITLHGNGGTFGSSSTSTATMYAGAGSTIKASDLETPSYPGLSLSGWSDQPSGGQSFAFPHPVSANLTLYAQWRGNSYTVTFDDASGTGGPASLTAAYNQTPPSLPSRPTRTGYTFGGYFTAKDGGGTEYYDGSGTPQGTWLETQDTTLHAQWTANTYTITFEKDGASGGSDNATVTYDQPPPSITPPSPMADGFIFAGYNTKPDGTGTKYYDGSGAPQSTWQEPKNTTLYAQWDYEAPSKGSDGKYEVSNAGNLLWIAEQVASGAEKDAKITLTTDIDVPDNKWQPIGTAQQAYTGTFDGDNHTIDLGSQALTGKGESYGLFGNVNGATVQDLTLEGDVTMNRTSAGADNHYGVIAYVSGNTTVTNVHSKVNLTIQDGFARGSTGGIVGYFGTDGSSETLTIERCSFSGTIAASTAYTDTLGGILAYRYASLSDTAILQDCLFDGEINVHSGQIGGLVGYNRTAGLTIKNCLVVGKITASNYEMVGYVVGLLLQHGTANTYITNNYYRDHGVPGLNSFGDALSNTGVYSATDDIGEYKSQTREGSAAKATEQELTDGTVLNKLNGSGSNWEAGSNGYPTLKNP